MTSSSIRVILADDHPVILEGVRYELERSSTISVVAVAPPLLTEFRSRGHAAMGNFCFGGTPPMAVFGRS
ncbi:response regulator [Paraburkholderia antibiotica]|uniref:hypothetical protein n=1 Tax=Paraburkholderia antibiotica TaxID=2728839 RepID=UPI00197DB388|nr:hypothetical protein [Paraburkholderia antibiotica]